MKNAIKKQITQEILKDTDASFAIVQAEFNSDITDALAGQCIRRLCELGAKETNIKHFYVPGSLEIAYAVNKISNHSNTLKPDVIIAIGTVIKGDTYHFEIVANESARMLSAISIQNDIPIINGILTTYTKEQAVDRIITKGSELADAAAKMLLFDMSLTSKKHLNK